MRELAFIPSITVTLLGALVEWPGLAQCAFFRRDKEFLKTLCEDYTKSHFMDLLSTRNDVLRMAQYLEITDIEDRIARLDLAASVYKLHDSLVEKLNYCLRDESELKRLVKKFGSEFFPLPVLPGNGSIVPIQTAEELFNEGQIMNNCVATYADQLEQGGCTIYRVFQPERCTLLISRSAHGKPEIEELKTFCNSEPSDDTIKAVRDWIKLCETSEKERILSEIATVENEVAPVGSTAGSMLVQQQW